MARKSDNHVFTANRLIDGKVVYRNGIGWIEDLKDATIIRNENEMIKIQSICNDDVQKNLVVAPYLIGVDIKSSEIKPLSIREHIRALGRTTI